MMKPMKKSRKKSHDLRTPALIGSSLLLVAFILSACSSPPKPAVPDGSNRVMINDPERIAALQKQVAQERAALMESNILKAELAAVKIQLDEMRSIVRSALTLPPAPAASAPQSALPIDPKAGPQLDSAKPQSSRKSSKANLKVSYFLSKESISIALDSLPEKSFETLPSGAMVRVFHPLGKTQFEPGADLAKILLDSAHKADAISIRGLTDSVKVDDINRQIARERAVNAWHWLVEHGVNPALIRTRYHSAGKFLAANNNAIGRALNRRSEIELRGEFPVSMPTEPYPEGKKI
jgi:outer membrane protein OmpA-like peptidoglycan-associated protein